MLDLSKFRSNQILITGGAGYIGSHTALALSAIGRQVVVIDNLSTGSRELIPSGVPFIEGDIANIDLMRRTIREYGCTSVIHFAGSIINPESFEKPLEYYSNNTVNSHTLLQACADENIRVFLFSSSAAVYGDAETLPISENAKLNPVGPYGASKLMTEWMLRDVAARYDMRYGALRYFNVAGADPKGRSGQVGPASHLIKISTEVAVGARQKMEIYGNDYPTEDGTCIRDYIHVSDLADAHVLALSYLEEKKANITANCGYGHGFSVRQVIDAVEKISEIPLNVEVGPRRIGDVSALVADNRNIMQLLPWTPKFDNLEVIIKSAYDWEKSRLK